MDLQINTRIVIDIENRQIRKIKNRLHTMKNKIFKNLVYKNFKKIHKKCSETLQKF